jgi:hypothetical protein
MLINAIKRSLQLKISEKRLNKLKKAGLTVGKNFHMQKGVIIDPPIVG